MKSYSAELKAWIKSLGNKKPAMTRDENISTVHLQVPSESPQLDIKARLALEKV